MNMAAISIWTALAILLLCALLLCALAIVLNAE